MIESSPRAVALRILAARHAEPARGAASYALAEYQHEAVARALVILEQRNGVVIADGVGLGKTFIAAALIEQHLSRGIGVVVVVPAALVRAWRQALSPIRELYPAALRLVTHGQLSRGLVPTHAGLVVVDEAHAFRNPRTRRYRSLRLATRAARVVLLTATPVNNSLSDLYFQLRVFARDDAFRDIGIGSLAMLLRPDEIDPNSLRRLHAAVIIRRSRADLRNRFPRIHLPDGSVLTFPEKVVVANVEYRPLVTCDVVQAFIDRMQFGIYAEQNPRVLLALSLVKRVQSGRAAALISVDRLIEFHRQFLDGLQRGYRLTPSNRIGADDEQLLFTELLAEPISPRFDQHSALSAVTNDVATLVEFRSRLADASDYKIDRLIRLLRSRPPPARTLVFTEFRDTAEDLWRRLRARFQTALITGKAAWLGESPASRWDVIRRFAPAANGAAAPSPVDAVHVLIATDVLAEGLNLQDADAVVSFDLPWNPVKLIQRAGRVNRIGSPHHLVTVHNLIPDREFDQLIGLVRRLREKLQNIRAAVGSDSPVLEMETTDFNWMSDVAASRPGILEQLAEPSAPFEHELSNLSVAAPFGSIGAITPAPRRILVVLQSSTGAIRELVVTTKEIVESAEPANQILEAALRRSECSCGSTYEIASAVEQAIAHLRKERVAPAGSPGAAAVTRAIQKAVQIQGVFASPDLVAAAENALAAVSDLSESAPVSLKRIRSARSALELKAAFEWIAAQSRATVHRQAVFTLIAALAAD